MAGGLPAHWFSTETDASSSRVARMSSVEQPKVLAGTPGWSMMVTAVLDFDTVKIKSPGHACGISTDTFTSLIVPLPPTAILELIEDVPFGKLIGVSLLE